MESILDYADVYLVPRELSLKKCRRRFLIDLINSGLGTKYPTTVMSQWRGRKLPVRVLMYLQNTLLEAYFSDRTSEKLDVGNVATVIYGNKECGDILNCGTKLDG